MEKLISEQLDLGEKIQRIIINFRKDPADRKRQRQYYEERLKRIDQAWKTFDSNNTRLEMLEGVDHDDEYFSENYYGKIIKVVNEYRGIFEAAMDSCDEAAISQQPGPNAQAAHPNMPFNGANLTKMLRDQRALIRAIERNITEIQSEGVNLSDINFCNLKYKLLERYHGNFITNNEALWAITEEDHLDGYSLEEFYELDTRIQNTLVMILQRISKIEEANSSGNSMGMQPHLPLPKVTIPKFDGNYLKWQQFYDLFNTMIHQQTIPSIQKMWYLKSNISGEAERLIQHLPLSENNYEVAWTIMKNRFENKRILTSALIQKLIDHAPLSNDARSIKNFHDCIHESLLALNSMDINTTSWDPLLMHIFIKRLDRQTHTLYEQSLADPKELQSISSFLAFLENRFQALELISIKDKDKTKATTSVATDTSNLCKICGQKGHPIYYCSKFLTLTAQERQRCIIKHKLCFNCLKPDHTANVCTSRSCSKCSQKHNTLLHLSNKAHNTATGYGPKTSLVEGKINTANLNTVDSTLTVAAANQASESRGYVLLATAKVKIIGNNERVCIVRALLDSGSQINLITERLIKQLSLSPAEAFLCIEGIGKSSRHAKKRVNVQVTSLENKFTSRMEAFVLPQIVSAQPLHDLDTSKWTLPNNIKLADSEFHRSGKIDVLLGAEFFYQVLRPGQISANGNTPNLQNTVFGWIIAGRIQRAATNTVMCAVFSEDEDTTNQLIERFWKLEDFDETDRQLTTAEQQCENHFAQNIAKTNDGRMIVRLPFLENPSVLGESKLTAINRFLALEKRLQNNLALKSEYKKFMDEYEALGHMERIKPNHVPTSHYFIPHHCVLKPDSTSTKLRVVFDASSKTSSGLALNDILHVGPTIQSDLFSIMIRFRTHRFVFTADVEKMYRQFLLNANDQNYQLIIWRNDPSEELKYFRLKTVTYGTTSAAYLATKCLQHLASENMTRYPLGARILLEDFYVDDCLSGADQISTAIEIQQQISALLKRAGLKLRKWCANHPQLLSGISTADQEINLDFNDPESQAISTLGLTWLPKTDHLCGKAQGIKTRKITKRFVSSDIARIFDPLGIFGPVVVKGKIFMQKLWQLKISWDEELPAHLQQEWIIFQNSILGLNCTKIPRHVFNHQVPTSIQMHTFVDASEQAFGAAIYLRSVYTNGQIIVRLLCAKSRVAPIKKQTLPRLELCAAVLGAQLTSRVKSDLRYQHTQTFFWSHSEIVISWINSTAASYQTFVANRIASIQKFSLASQWRHVTSKDNPADLLTRVTSKKLLTQDNWFYGPFFLHGNACQWPKPFSKALEISTDLEIKKKYTIATIAETNKLEQLIYNINHRNSFKFLQRTVAYMLRFLQHVKAPHKNRPVHISLQPQELKNALALLVRVIQQADFGEDIKALKSHKGLSSSNMLNNLTPFLDEEGILRVGGRLEASNLVYDAKHPILLPYNDPIVKLLFQLKHEEHSHCDPQTLLGILRQQFWPIKGKIMARNIVHNCIRCTRAKPKLMTQIMGNLLADRVTSARPFLNAGVDYCGPFWVHYKVRGKKPHKVYLAVFCCFATKAVHLEVVSDLTTEAFISALRRFISRRGRCQVIHCDNATNFVGANNLLQEINEAIYSSSAKESITKTCSNEGISFKFIPPRAPHFGGLWEAAVKWAKHLLIRSVSTASLTHEELETVVIEIEVVLNSRPISPMSSNPNDLTALTPGHFLIGDPLTAQRDPNTAQLKTTLTNRWRLMSQLKHEFWVRWSREYLNELQYRNKWKTDSNNIKEGMLVIIKEDNLSPMQWSLGRIERVYVGNDGIIRVVDLKTKSGILKRPIHKLAPLLNEDANNQQGLEHVEISGNKANSKRRQSSPENRSPAKRVNLNTFTIMMIALLLAIPAAICGQINLRQFDENPGIYYEEIGTTMVATAEWKLMVYFNTTLDRTYKSFIRNIIHEIFMYKVTDEDSM